MMETSEISANEPGIYDAKLLMVDDEPINLILLKQILEQAGYRDIQSTSDARKAQTLCREFHPDLILLDLMMPHMDGLTVINRIRGENREAADIPIVILTADNSLQTKRRIMASGATDCLTKPLEMEGLLRCISDLLTIHFLDKPQK